MRAFHRSVLSVIEEAHGIGCIGRFTLKMYERELGAMKGPSEHDHSLRLPGCVHAFLTLKFAERSGDEYLFDRFHLLGSTDLIQPWQNHLVQFLRTKFAGLLLNCATTGNADRTIARAATRSAVGGIGVNSSSIFSSTETIMPYEPSWGGAETPRPAPALLSRMDDLRETLHELNHLKGCRISVVLTE
jgi:hypothetical protein